LRAAKTCLRGRSREACDIGDICFLSQQAIEEITFRTWYKACWDKKRQFHGTLCFWKFHGTLCFWQTMKLPEQQNLAKAVTCDLKNHWARVEFSPQAVYGTGDR